MGIRMLVKNEMIQNSSEDSKGSKGYSVSGIYETFGPLMKLYGDSYDVIRKATFYSIIGSVICRNKILCSNIHEDTRINLFIPLKSGHGKREIKEVIRQSISQVGLDCCEPTSLHQEQLIGKSIISKKGNSYVIRGHLDDDFLVFEEATELFTEKTNQETRDYIKIALDPIGYNEIYKKSVDTHKKNAVRYCPECTIVFFFQPLPLDDKIATRGLLRRGIILSVEPGKSERYNALEQSFENKDVSENWDQWIDFLIKVKSKTFNWEFSDEVTEKIKELSIKLIKMGERKGNKASAYTDIMFFTLRNLLIKFSCIQAAINDRNVISILDVVNAYEDLSVFWDIQLDFVIQKVKGDMDYMDLNKKEKSCLLILQSEKCFSEDSSSMMIKQYISRISSELDCTGDSAKHYYYGLKGSGYIDSKQVGKHNSKAWLTELGKKKVEPYQTLASLTTLKQKNTILQRIRRRSKPDSR